MIKLKYTKKALCLRACCSRMLNVLLVVILSSNMLSAQDPNFSWIKRLGGASNDVGFGVASDPNGNAYVVGTYTTSGNFNSGGTGGELTSAGSSDAFLVKYDSTGKFLWVKSLGGSGEDTAYAVTTDASGNVIVTGSFGSSNFNPGGSGGTFATAGLQDIFVAKFNSGGTLLWSKCIGGTANDIGRGVAADGSGNIYLTGYFRSTNVNFNPGGTGGTLTPTGLDDAFLVKYDPNGSYLWGKNLGGSGMDLGFAVTADGTGNVFVTGTYSKDGANFNPGGTGGTHTATYGAEDVFLAKYTSAGVFLWSKNMGGSANGDRGYGLAADPSGNIYVAGSFAQTGEFNMGAGGGLVNTAGAHDAFVAKYDVSGGLIWVRAGGGKGGDYAYSVATDPNSNVYIIGFVGDPGGDFNRGGPDGVVTAPNGNVFIAKYAAMGDFLWVKSRGGPSFDYGYGIASHPSGNLYLTGWFYNSMNFNPGGTGGSVSSTGAYDGFIVGLRQKCEVYSFFTETACDSFVLNGRTYTQSGVYKDTLVTGTNCDSIVTLSLTIKGLSTVNPVETGQFCDSASFNGVTYTSSGNYWQYYSNADGCDSNINYELTIGHSNAASLSISACDSFEYQGIVYTNSDIIFGTFTNASGCDSGVVLDLTINTKPEALVTKSDSTLRANEADGYQWVDCDQNFQPVPGATTRSFTPQVTGNYAVIITQSGCEDTSICVPVEIIVGVGLLGADSKMALFPNPAYNSLTIQSAHSLKGATIRVMNAVGQTIHKQAGAVGNVVTLDVSKYDNGIYIVEIIEGDHSVRMRWVKTDE